MDVNNPIIQLLISGTQAEFDRNMELACERYQQAWNLAADDYEACMAAHYMARCQENIEDALHWNLEALQRAIRVADGRTRDFFPSLYLNLGKSYEQMGDLNEAKRYYNLAAQRSANPLRE